MTKHRYRSTFTFEGKRYECAGTTKQEADKKAALKEDQLKRGEIGISGNMSVRKWANEWIDVYKRPIIGYGQLRNYQSIINGAIFPAIGDMSITSVKEIHLQRIMNAHTGYSKSYLMKLRATMKGMFERAKSSKLILYSPAENLELPAATDGTHRSINDYERKYILHLADTHHAGLWIKTLLYTGIRPGESRALDWRHVNFDRGILHIEQSIKASTETIGTPKSIAGIRDIPIPTSLLGDFVRSRAEPFDPIFKQITTNQRHTTASMRGLWGSFKRDLDILMGAKVYRNKIILSVVATDLVPYCLRHAYCTDLQDAGVPINIARYLMGHTDIATTAKIYTETTDRAIQIAAEKINAFRAI